MAASHLYSLLEVLQLTRPVFTQPSFLRFVVLFAGWVRCTGVHAVTEALVRSGVSGVHHHAAFHRFFSRARWSVDEVGRRVLLHLCTRLGGPLRLVLDDTLCSHKGPEVFGLGTHLDAVRSTRRVRTFAFGHVWVVLAVLVQPPFCTRPWALPILFRLYRTQADCEAAGVEHCKKTTLGRQLVDLVLAWLPDTHVELVTDRGYSNSTLLRGLPARVTFIGAMGEEAALSRPRKRPGRSSLTGRKLTKALRVPNPAQLATTSSLPWRTLSVRLYGCSRTLRYKQLVAHWRAAGPRLLRIVIVQMDTGKLPYRVFFCTDTGCPVRRVLEAYAGRWAIEVLFRDLKQLMGFAASQARTRLAVLRTTPWVGLSSSLLVLWFLLLDTDLKHLGLPLRPWYRTKDTVSFADILRLAQDTLVGVDWTHPARTLHRILSSAATAPPQARAA
jgi:hypothetical protein